MSWEGYFQHICKKGHYWSKCAEYTDEDVTCSICGSPVVWTNIVDITNGSFEGKKRIDGYIELEVNKETKCKECGQTLEVIYKIPNTKRRKQ
jgi:hypothetical protein